MRKLLPSMTTGRRDAGRGRDGEVQRAVVLLIYLGPML